MDRVALGRMQNPVRGFLHGTAGLVSIVGLVALLLNTSGPLLTAAISIYGAALIGMYATSAMYHSVPWSPDAKTWIQRLDHTMIYVLVAATMTPLVIAVGHGFAEILSLASIWALVALGIGKELAQAEHKKSWLRLQFVAVGLAAAAFLPALTQMSLSVVVLIAVGGVIYLVGTLVMVMGRPILAPRVFSHHEVFHVMVIVASVLHFIGVWQVVVNGYPLGV
jgi:hemolysin III